jgi:hypothetical protein
MESVSVSHVCGHIRVLCKNNCPSDLYATQVVLLAILTGQGNAAVTNLLVDSMVRYPSPHYPMVCDPLRSGSLVRFDLTLDGDMDLDTLHDLVALNGTRGAYRGTVALGTYFLVRTDRPEDLTPFFRCTFPVRHRHATDIVKTMVLQSRIPESTMRAVREVYEAVRKDIDEWNRSYQHPMTRRQYASRRRPKPQPMVGAPSTSSSDVRDVGVGVRGTIRGCSTPPYESPPTSDQVASLLATHGIPFPGWNPGRCPEHTGTGVRYVMVNGGQVCPLCDTVHHNMGNVNFVSYSKGRLYLKCFDSNARGWYRRL